MMFMAFEEKQPHKVGSAIDSKGNIILPLPLHGKWLRFKEPITYDLPLTELITGQKGTGKSSLIENITTHYVGVHDKNKCFDVFGSRDNEGIAWLRSPYSEQCLLICADNCDLSSSWDWKHLKDVNLQSVAKYKMIISVSAFYKEVKDEHFMVKSIMDMLWQRTQWSTLNCLTMREMANLIYSRLSIGEDQHEAKAYFIYVMREARHMGIPLIGDTIRYMSTDVDLRSLADRLYIKAVGKEGLPDNLRYLYKYVDLKSILRMPVQRYALITRMGSIGRGAFAFPPWHKTEHENMFQMFGIKVDFGDKIEYGTRGFNPVSDYMHSEMVQLSAGKFMQDATGEMVKASCGNIAKKVERSTRTIHANLRGHDEDIENFGFCQKCKRINSPMFMTPSNMLRKANH
jgi:hypothetical protein